VYTFTKLHDRRIPNVGVGVRVGVGPVECQLKRGFFCRCVELIEVLMAGRLRYATAARNGAINGNLFADRPTERGGSWEAG